MKTILSILLLAFLSVISSVVAKPANLGAAALPRRRRSTPTTPNVNAHELDGPALTNAERFKRGLPPLAPTRRFNHLAPRLPVVSPVCLTEVSDLGYILVTRLSDGVDLGFIGSNLNSNGGWTVAGVNDSPATFATWTNGPPNGAVYNHPINLFYLGVAPQDLNYLGAVGPGSINLWDLKPNHLGYVFLALTKPTNENDPPQFPDNPKSTFVYNGPIESKIFSIDCVTLQITPQWVNFDNSQPKYPNVFMFDGTGLGITGDIVKLEQSYNEFYEVYFTWVPTS